MPRFHSPLIEPDGRRVGRQRGALTGPFPSAPLRTDRDRFRSISSPVDGIHSVQVIVHLAPLAFEMSPGLSPFAVWPALPSSDYYGDSVALGLAPGRPSRVPSVLNASSMTWASHSSPSIGSLPIALPVGGGSPQKGTVCPRGTLRCRRCSSECAFSPLGIGIEAIQLSPYHAGLAGRHLQRLPVAPAFRACYCPLWLSPSG